MTVSNGRVSFRSWFRPGCIALAILFLAGCGGGGGSGGGIAESDGSGRGAAGRLPISYEPIGNYGTSSLPWPDARDAKHMPVYADGYGNGQGLFVGIHQELDVSSLSVAGRRGETVMRHGRLDDGAGRTAVAEYLSEVYGPDNYIYGVDDRAERYASPPVVRVIGDATPHETDMVIRAVQLVNTALPEEAKLSIGAPMPGFSLARYSNGGRFSGGSHALRNTIQVEFYPRDSDGPHGIAAGSPPEGYGYVEINRNSPQTGSAVIQTVIHEIIHSLAGFDHVTVSPSIMNTHDNVNRLPISFLAPVDREALRALHHRLDSGDDPTSFGSWASTALVIHGSNGHANFGVALRNDYAEPWSEGYRPNTDLAQNGSLAGTATWSGELLGITPSRAAVAGDAEISVVMSSMRGRAEFTNLESWGPNAAPGVAGTGTVWFDGNLGYSIAVDGNTFRETGGSAGRLTGVFVGRNHEGTTGTLERSDLTAAFGASR